MKNTRKTQKSKRIKKSRKTKRIKKGGADPEYKVIDPNNKTKILDAIKRFCNDKELPNIIQLMEKLSRNSGSRNPFEFRYKVKFTLADEVFLKPQSCFDWYTSINPGFELFTKDTKLPFKNSECQYEPLVMGMVKDVLAVCVILDTLPKPEHKTRGLDNEHNSDEPEDTNNKSSLLLLQENALKSTDFLAKALECLKSFNELIEKGYHYFDFIDSLSKYIGLFTTGCNDSMNQCKNDQQTLTNFKSSFFMLLPTFNQISHQKVLNSCAAPVLNFRLSKERTFVHQQDHKPSFEVLHDIEFHGNRTHNLGRYFDLRDDELKYDKKDLIQPTPAKIKSEFTQKSENLNNIYELYTYNFAQVDKDIEKLENYTDPNTGNIVLSENIKYIYACILFYIIHEMEVWRVFHESGFKLVYYPSLLLKFITEAINFSDPTYTYELFLNELTYNGKPRFMLSITKSEFENIVANLYREIEKIRQNKKRINLGTVEFHI